MLASPLRQARRLALAGLAAATLTAAVAVVALPAFAATTTLFASPSGTGTACSAAQPCSLTAAQTAVRALNSAMSDDIVVQLADGVYRLSSPLRFTAADSGNNGHTVIWQAAAVGAPGRSAARGRSPAGRSPTPARTSGGPTSAPGSTPGSSTSTAPSPPGRAPVNRSDFTATNTGLRFTNSALSYLNNLANQNRVQLESVGSFTDRYVPVQSISGNFITMQQPGWNNNTFGLRHPHQPAPGGSALPGERRTSSWTRPASGTSTPATGTLYYIPLAGQNMSTVSVELPLLQSLVDVGGTYDAPAHHISFAGITFTGTSWLGPSSNQGYADQQTGAYIAGNWNWPALSRPARRAATQFEATRPNWSQMPAAVQVSAANTITFSDSQFVNLGQTAIGIGNDANAHASGVGLGASNITVTRSEIARDSAGGIVVGGVRADAHHPSDQRMVNRDITISNNRIHDLGVGLPGHRLGPDHLRHQRHHVAQRGLQPAVHRHVDRVRLGRQRARRQHRTTPTAACTTTSRGTPRPTTASNNRLIGNYVHDVMQQMTDGGCIYTLSANPSAVISDNYCLRTNGWFGLYFDEGSKLLHRAQQRLLRRRHLGHRQLLRRREHGQLHRHQQLGQQRQHQRDQRRPRQRRQRQRHRHERQLARRRPVRDRVGRRPEPRPAPRPARSWAASRAAASTSTTPARPTAPRRSCGTATAAPTSGGPTRRASSSWCTATSAWTPTAGTTNGTAAVDLGLQRPDQPAVERQRQRHHHRRAVRAVPGRQRRRHGERHEDHPLVLQRRRPTSNGACVV